MHWISSILFDFVRLYWFDWFENRTHSKIGVRFCSIAEPNRTIGVRLGSIGFLFGFVRLDRSGSVIIIRHGGSGRENSHDELL